LRGDGIFDDDKFIAESLGEKKLLKNRWAFGEITAMKNTMPSV